MTTGRINQVSRQKVVQQQSTTVTAMPCTQKLFQLYTLIHSTKLTQKHLGFQPTYEFTIRSNTSCAFNRELVARTLKPIKKQYATTISETVQHSLCYPFPQSRCVLVAYLLLTYQERKQNDQRKHDSLLLCPTLQHHCTRLAQLTQYSSTTLVQQATQSFHSRKKLVC